MEIDHRVHLARNLCTMSVDSGKPKPAQINPKNEKTSNQQQVERNNLPDNLKWYQGCVRQILPAIFFANFAVHKQLFR
jgi:hypothetical protein